MNIAYLLIGGNEGDRSAYLQETTRRIQYPGSRLLQASSIYETAAWGKTDQAAFLNQALALETPLDAPALMKRLLATEEELGRVRTERYGSRTIDIDILFFNEDVIQLPWLTIPHPEVARRRFALTPLDEIAPGYIHPVLHKTIHRLLAECPDLLEVKKL
ncbi:MAG: 2-amino-4-hydroxy-6-hydroxymethyldihydropteridine diphosphokinase [Sphingobacteriales bacterium 50-39]|nr:2-amino-4-hydroxy-6-hydroxymethyldihydropteridine diphosphokinase [Sphingobacteriales bacterium]OJW55366.1 MAG: 2-amino-4-hydroxy-6-hydroxymethyldihydropteridine diphosphokinase [Sphingobacteriales bacterium 50-39]